ncbi:response regulator [Deinococcus pimensis]|uniref:response regulator n=1 Tax=Deinococcus pimensis TaxID=309888 RepID=UPI0004B22A7C|nr:response regulator [Deinococcus pimensis]
MILTHHTTRVLIIDDHDLDVELTRHALHQVAPNAQVGHTNDPEKALHDLTADHAVLPDLVLLDLNMPVLHGHDVLAALRAHPRTRHLRVVVCSTSDREADRQRSLTLGADAYLVKPLTDDELKAELNTLLHGTLPIDLAS